VKTVSLSWNICAGVVEYRYFMQQLGAQLVKTTTMLPILQRAVVLGVQKYKPDYWIHVALKGQGRGESTLAIQADKLYLVGFLAQGAWFIF
jgi:hypothetical protein